MNIVVTGVTLESLSDGREVVTVTENGVDRVAYDGTDREEAHKVNWGLMMQMRSWQHYFARNLADATQNPTLQEP